MTGLTCATELVTEARRSDNLEVGDRHGLGAAPSDQFKVANFTFSVTVLPCEPLCSANISRICWETAL